MYIYSIKKIINFAKINKKKVMKLPSDERLLEMWNLIKIAGLSFELDKKSRDEVDDTLYELRDILEIAIPRKRVDSDLDYRVMMLIDDIVMTKIKNIIDESIYELIIMLNGDFDDIAIYLSNKYDFHIW